MPEHEPITPSESVPEGEQLALFDLLSAYLDGEVTAEERLWVQQRLDTDRQFKKLYLQLLRLQKEVPLIPTPALDVELIQAQVMQRLDKRRNRRVVLLGSGIIAALTWGLTILFAPPSRVEVAEEVEPLIIALNHPIIELPSPGEEFPRK